MLWNRDQLPESLRDKKPEEIEAAFKKLEEMEAKSKDNETRRGELETKYNQREEEFNQLKAKLEEMQQAEAQRQAASYQAEPNQKPPEQPTIWNDPDAYIQSKLYPMQLGVLANARTNAKYSFERALSPRDQKIYRKYEGEVERVMQGYDWGRQGDPGCWNTALTYVRGLHDQDISKAESSDEPFFSEPASRGGPDVSEPGDSEKLTDEEQEVCRRFHWDPEGYLKRKKEMNLHQSEKGAYARFPVPERSRA